MFDARRKSTEIGHTATASFLIFGIILSQAVSNVSSPYGQILSWLVAGSMALISMTTVGLKWMDSARFSVLSIATPGMRVQ